MKREDFPMLEKDLIYFDNGATTLKPYCVMERMNDYYFNYSANAHRGDYNISYKVDLEFENTRDLVQEFINARNREEIVFTSGATEGLNMIVTGFFKNVLEPGDEILITDAEHAANVIPWYILSNKNGLKVKNIELDDNYEVTLDNVKNAITPNTKVISLAHVTNVIGDLRPIKEICEYAHNLGIFVVVDGAQSVPHMEVDVIELDVDFLVFSGHKMLGPTGIGVLYGRKELLEHLEPLSYGGGMNVSFENEREIILKTLPARLEAGTPNIAGVIGLGEAINYINSIGFEKINEHERFLKKYLVDKLLDIPHIDVINPNSESGIVSFNVEGVSSQDVAFYLNKYNICVRAGNHCAKNLKNEIGVPNTCRVSMYIYNTTEEIDKLVELLKKDPKTILEGSI